MPKEWWNQHSLPDYVKKSLVCSTYTNPAHSGHVSGDKLKNVLLATISRCVLRDCSVRTRVHHSPIHYRLLTLGSDQFGCRFGFID